MKLRMFLWVHDFHQLSLGGTCANLNCPDFLLDALGCGPAVSGDITFGLQE